MACGDSFLKRWGDETGSRISADELSRLKGCAICFATRSSNKQTPRGSSKPPAAHVHARGGVTAEVTRAHYHALTPCTGADIVLGGPESYAKRRAPPPSVMRPRRLRLNRGEPSNWSLTRNDGQLTCSDSFDNTRHDIVGQSRICEPVPASMMNPSHLALLVRDHLDDLQREADHHRRGRTCTLIDDDLDRLIRRERSGRSGLWRTIGLLRALFSRRS